MPIPTDPLLSRSGTSATRTPGCWTSMSAGCGTRPRASPTPAPASGPSSSTKASTTPTPISRPTTTPPWTTTSRSGRSIPSAPRPMPTAPPSPASSARRQRHGRGRRRLRDRARRLPNRRVHFGCLAPGHPRRHPSRRRSAQWRRHEHQPGHRQRRHSEFGVGYNAARFDEIEASIGDAVDHGRGGLGMTIVKSAGNSRVRRLRRQRRRLDQRHAPGRRRRRRPERLRLQLFELRRGGAGVGLRHPGRGGHHRPCRRGRLRRPATSPRPSTEHPRRRRW